MSKYCLFLIVIYYLTGGNNSMSRFFKFGKLHVTKGNGDKLLDILLTASKYFRIGEKKLRKLAEENLDAGWVIVNGNRIQIKRKQFEKIIDTLDEI
jgi:hypothetical protein